MTLSRSFGARPALRFAAVALLIVITAHDAAAQRGRRGSRDARSEVDTTFAFDKNGTVTVNVPNGDIVIAGTTGNQIHIRAKSESDDLRVDASTSSVMIQTSNHDASAELSVPQGVRVIVQSRSGDVTIRGTHGEVEVHGTSGDINIDDVVGRLEVGNLSGDITVSNVAGNGDVSTTGGDVKFTNVRGDLDVGTVSGEIELRGITAKNVRAKTTSGDVTFARAVAEVLPAEVRVAAREVAERFRALREVLVQRDSAGVAPLLETRVIEATELTMQRKASEAELASQAAEMESLVGAFTLERV